jgi:hypothetical protein
MRVHLIISLILITSLSTTVFAQTATSVKSSEQALITISPERAEELRAFIRKQPVNAKVLLILIPGHEIIGRVGERRSSDFDLKVGSSVQTIQYSQLQYAEKRRWWFRHFLVDVVGFGGASWELFGIVFLGKPE